MMAITDEEIKKEAENVLQYSEFQNNIIVKELVEKGIEKGLFMEIKRVRKVADGWYKAKDNKNPIAIGEFINQLELWGNKRWHQK